MARMRISDIRPQEAMRQFVNVLDNVPITSDYTSDIIKSDNMTGVVIWVKADSATGMPAYALSIETSPDEDDSNFVEIDAISKPSLGVITDNNPHVYSINLSNIHEYWRFKITLKSGDAGDDRFWFRMCFLYGNFTHASDVTLETGDLEIGAVEIKDGTTNNKAIVNAASTIRKSSDNVLLVQALDGNGYVVGGSVGPSTPQAYAISATGQDTYTTIITASGLKTNMFVSIGGANPAIISIDGGNTDHFYIPANSAHVFSNILITNGTVIKAKNATAGQSYTNLSITLW
jgi:hypothetical protein